MSMDNAGLYAKWKIPPSRPAQQAHLTTTPFFQAIQTQASDAPTKGKVPCTLHLAEQTGHVWTSFGGTVEVVHQGYPPFQFLPGLREFIPTCLLSYHNNPNYVAMGTQCGTLFLFTRTKIWKLGQFGEPVADIAWAGRTAEKALLVITTATRIEFRSMSMAKTKDKIKQSLVTQAECPNSPNLLLLRAETTPKMILPRVVTSPNRFLIAYLQSRFVLLWRWTFQESQHNIYHHGFLGFLGNALDLCFSADGKYLYLLTDRNVLCVYDTTKPPEPENPWKVIHEYFLLQQADIVHSEILRTIMMFRLHLRNFQPVAVVPLESGSSPARVIAASKHHVAIGRKDGAIELLDEPMLALEVKRVQVALRAAIRNSPILKRTPIPRRKSREDFAQVPSC